MSQRNSEYARDGMGAAMTRYSRGANFERAVRAELESYNWAVMRSAGSHGPADLAAFAPGPTVVLVQCKIDGKIPKQEREEFIRHCLGLNCIPVLAYKDSGIKYLELFEGAPMPWHPGGWE